MNGTDTIKTSARSASDVTAIKTHLAESKKDIAMLSINPANSPYFTIAGMRTLTGNNDFSSSEKGYFVINGAQTLEVSVFMGSDSIELVDDKVNTPEEDRIFYAYVVECEDDGTPKADASPIKLYSKSKEIGTGANKKIYYSIGGKQGHTTTSGAYVFTIPIAKKLIPDPDIIDPATGVKKQIDTGLEIGKNYRIYVNGKDNENNPIESYETGYGFHLSSGGGVPILTVTEPAEPTAFYKKDETVRFAGTVKSEEGEPEISVWYGDEKLKDGTITGVEGNVFEFICEVPASKFASAEPNKSKIYSLEVRAVHGDAGTMAPFSIWYDVDAPDITINSIQPYFEYDYVANKFGQVTKRTISLRFWRIEGKHNRIEVIPFWETLRFLNFKFNRARKRALACKTEVDKMQGLLKAYKVSNKDSFSYRLFAWYIRKRHYFEYKDVLKYFKLTDISDVK